GSVRAAMAWQTRSLSMTRWPRRSAGRRCTCPVSHMFNVIADHLMRLDGVLLGRYVAGGPRAQPGVQPAQRSPVRSRRCPATVVPFGGEPGRLCCADDVALDGRAVRSVPPPSQRSPSAGHRLPLPAVLLACAALLLVSMVVGVAVGSVPLSPGAVLQ